MPSFVGLLLDLALYNLKKRDFIAEYWMSENFIPAPYASLGHKNRAVFLREEAKYDKYKMLIWNLYVNFLYI